MKISAPVVYLNFVIYSFDLNMECKQQTKNNFSSKVILYNEVSQRNYLPYLRNITGHYFGRFI